MDSLEFQISSLNLKIDRLMTIVEKHANESPIVIKEASNEASQWVDLREAQKMKGDCALATLRTRPYLQPCAGTGYTMTAHKKLWPRVEVERWAKLTAEELYDYCLSYQVEAPLSYKMLAESKKRREALLA